MVYINYLLEFHRVDYRGTHASRSERNRHRAGTVLHRAAARLGVKLAAIAVRRALVLR